MKPREKTLLVVFVALFAVIVGGGLLGLSLKSYFSITRETEAFRRRVAAMKETIAEGERWQQRSEWIRAHAPSYVSREEASSKLLDAVQAEAGKAGISLGSRELVKEPKAAEGEGAPRSFSQASVKLSITSVGEKQLFTWLHALQNPASFVGITRVAITPAADSKTVNCEAQVTHFYRETQAPRLTNHDLP